MVMKTFKESEQIYVLENDKLSVEISNRGASIRSIWFSGRELSLGFSSQSDRIKSNTYSGAVIGRVANRIADGKFMLNGTTYSLSRNDGKNTLHGGKIGFDQRLFSVQILDTTSLVMSLNSPDGDQGFPGTLTTRVKFSVVGTELRMDFSAVCDKDTFWAPTIHPYFRLGDDKTVDKTYLTINADYYTPIDANLIPTGEIRSVAGTPFDFRNSKEIGADIESNELKQTNGYDHNFALNNERKVEKDYVAKAFDKSSGIEMEIYTDLPGLQFYSGNYLKGFSNSHYIQPHEGFALEPQFFPNAVNTPIFKQPLLKKAEFKSYFIKYRFYHKGRS